LARGRDEGDSVFDFIYVDHRRLGLYLAQFSEFGNLTNLVRSVRASDSREFGADIKVVKGGTKAEQVTGIEKHYDAQWAAPLTFLDEVQGRDMLKTEVENARIGDLMILPGRLNLVDLQIFARSFEAMAGATASATRTENRKERRAAQNRTKREEISTIPSPASAGDSLSFKILASLDQPLMMLFQTEQNRFWSTIDPTCVIGGSTHLHLKYGATIGGDWHMIGILDCLPGDGGSDITQTGRICGDGINTFNSAIQSVIRELRIIMGRPGDCYGITPLIIMREVG
jgi:hypothetical protein